MTEPLDCAKPCRRLSARGLVTLTSLLSLANLVCVAIAFGSDTMRSSIEEVFQRADDGQSSEIRAPNDRLTQLVQEAWAPRDTTSMDTAFMLGQPWTGFGSSSYVGGFSAPSGRPSVSKQEDQYAKEDAAKWMMVCCVFVPSCLEPCSCCPRWPPGVPLSSASGCRLTNWPTRG